MKRHRLTKALEELEREGMLEHGRREVVEERLASELFGRRDATSTFVNIVAVLGGVLVGMGLIYLVAYNWQELGKVVQLAIVFGTLAALWASGYVLAEQPGHHPILGRALYLAGVLGYGAAIFLVAQIYQLESDYPHALLLWWAGSIPSLLYTRSIPILYAVLAVGITWITWHTGSWVDAEAHATPQSVAVGVGLAGSGAGALLLAIAGAASRGRWQSLTPHLSLVGAGMALFGPYVLSIKGVGGELDHPASVRVLLPLAACLGVAALFAAFALRSGETRYTLGTAAAAIGTVLLATASTLVPGATHVMAHVLVMSGIVGLVALGVRTQRAALVDLALGIFVLVAGTRYVEYLWDKLEGSIAFLVTGALLLLIGFVVERGHRRWVGHVREVTA